MADELETYLSGGYQADKASLDDVQGLIDESLGTFARSFLDNPGTWSYELKSNGDDPRVPETVSFSTTAMIAFALGLAIGKIRGSSLAPTSGDPQGTNPQRQEATGHVDTALNCLTKASPRVAAKVKKRVAGGDPKPIAEQPLTESATFGWDDPFTLTWLLEALHAFPDPKRDKFLAAVQTRAVDVVQRFASDPVGAGLEIKQDDRVTHAFPLLRAIQLGHSLARLQGHEHVTGLFDLAAARAYLSDRIQIELSKSHIPDGSFDAADLVFSLEAWVLTSPSEPELAIVDQVFQVLTEGQERTPYWRPLRPFKATRQGLILLPQSVETANAMLRICSSPALGARDYFSQHYRLLDRYRRWLQGRVFRGSLTSGLRFTGWESEHTYTDDRIHLWQTSQVLIFLQHYLAMRQRHIARKLLSLVPLVPELRATASSARPSDPVAAWSDWRTRDPVSADTVDPTSRYLVYEQIELDFIRPRASEQESPSYSMLLYGPPGTGKSTIARKLAEALGYSLLTVTPSDFLTGGGEAVEARAKAIFEVLAEQRDMVVLFDEIDHLLLDRDSGFYSDQGDVFKLLTPGMLTKLNKLAGSQRVIVVIATNYYERIDRAIKRPGRIDARYLVLPPDLSQRQRHLADVAAGWNTLPTRDQEALAKATALFTYKELDELAAHAQKRHPLTPEELLSALQATIREAPPLINLEGYSQRLGMKWNHAALEQFDVKTVEKPWEEVAMLAFLTLQDRWPDRPHWLPQAVKEALDRGLVADLTVTNALEAALKHLSGGPSSDGPETVAS